MAKLRIAYVLNNASFLVSHRLPLVLAARNEGYEVVLVTGKASSVTTESGANKKLAELGIKHRRTVFRSSGTNPTVEIVGFFQLIYYLLKFNPDIVHCASPKGVLYGGIASRVCRFQGLVLAISGMGYISTNSTEQILIRKIYRWLYITLARFTFNHPNMRVIVQNKDDYTLIRNLGLAAESQFVFIPGSGVDLSLFENCRINDKKKVVLLPARMIRDKGIKEFVVAAKKIKQYEPAWRFILAGAADYDSPTSIPEACLKLWQSNGVVEWLGHIDDMVPLFEQAAIVCLPSYYGEGMPKALLEAAAASCAIVTTNTTGCRDAIEVNVTGDLVPPHDSDELAATILALIRDDARRKVYGTNGRKRAINLFSIKTVIDATLEIYKNLSSKPSC